jgi:hypothetical protein
LFSKKWVDGGAEAVFVARREKAFLLYTKRLRFFVDLLDGRKHRAEVFGVIVIERKLGWLAWLDVVMHLNMSSGEPKSRNSWV